MKIAGAQLPIVGRIPVKFQQNWPKTVGGEAHTKLRLRTDGRTDRRTDRQPDSSIPPPNFVVGGIIMVLLN